MKLYFSWTSARLMMARVTRPSCAPTELLLLLLPWLYLQRMVYNQLLDRGAARTVLVGSEAAVRDVVYQGIGDKRWYTAFNAEGTFKVRSVPAASVSVGHQLP
jgi:hypothetical protein